VISTGLKIPYSYLYRKYINHITFLTSFFTLPFHLVASPQHDLFFIMLFEFVMACIPHMRENMWSLLSEPG
jgi:hypothetical protein